MVASSNDSSSDWFIDESGCTTHTSGHQSMFITYTEYLPNMKKLTGYNGVRLFESGYGSVKLVCQLRDGKMETIILQEVVYLMGSCNLISQSQIMDKDIKVDPVNHYSPNLFNRHCKLITTAPQVDGLFVLDRVPDRESTEYTDLDNSCLLALNTTGHASRHYAEMWMLWHRRLAHVGLQPLEILPKVVADAPKITGKCDWESCIKSKLTRKPFTLNRTSRATEHLQRVHTDICGPMETAIGRGGYMLLFIDDATRDMDEYILK